MNKSKRTISVLLALLMVSMVVLPSVNAASGNNQNENMTELYLEEAGSSRVIPELFVYLGGILVEGLIFMGGTWVVVNTYNEGLASTAKKTLNAINSYTPSNVPSRSKSVHVNSSGTIQYFIDPNGCVMSRGGNTWDCPLFLDN